MTILMVRFLRDQSGVGRGELLLVAGTAALIIPSMDNYGNRLAEVFESVTRALR